MHDYIQYTVFHKECIKCKKLIDRTKLSTILLTLLITSCAYIPDTLIVKDKGFKRDVRGELILKTTKETNPYLQEDFVAINIKLALNPLPRLKKKPVIVYYQNVGDVVTIMSKISNNKDKYQVIGYYSPNNKYEKNSKRDMEEAGILLGASFLIVINFKEAIEDGKVKGIKSEVAFISTNINK